MLDDEKKKLKNIMESSKDEEEDKLQAPPWATQAETSDEKPETPEQPEPKEEQTGPLYPKESTDSSFPPPPPAQPQMPKREPPPAQPQMPKREPPPAQPQMPKREPPPPPKPLPSFKLPPRYRPDPEPEKQEQSKLPFILSGVALAISIAALLISVFGYVSTPAQPHGDMASIADDLKKIRDSEIELEAPIQTVTSIDADIPINDAVDDVIQIPISTEIPLSGKVSGTSPWGTVVEIPVKGTIPVQIIANLSMGETSQKISITTSVDSETSTKLKVSPSDYWGEELNRIIDKLEKMSG